MIKEAIVKIVQKEDLSYEEAYTVMSEIMTGETSPTQNAAFLAALSTKSTHAETIAEISGCANAMRDHALPFHTYGEKTFEIVGTGGDGAHSINISTASAILIASAGVKVTKHGNVAASSRCGTANVLDALGVNTHLTPSQMEQVFQKVGLCFLHAQVYHASMKYVGAIRKELGFRTVFNILGPLTNPAHPTYQLMGVYDPHLVEPLARVLAQLGVQRGMVVYGQDKLDEISISAPTSVCEFQNGSFCSYEIKPENFGLMRGTKEEIAGGDPEYNAEILRNILNGTITGPKRDVVCMNAGAGLYLAGEAASITDGIRLAGTLIDNGKATEKLECLIQATKAESEVA